MQAKVDELQQNVSKLAEEKADTEKKMQSVKTELEQSWQEEQVKVEALEQDKTTMDEPGEGADGPDCAGQPEAGGFAEYARHDGGALAGDAGGVRQADERKGRAGSQTA